MKAIKFQPSEYTDHMTDDGHEMTKLPWPIVAEPGEIYGDVVGDHWQGTIVKVIGFQKDLSKQQIDLHWTDAVKDPQLTVGMYIVTSDKNGKFAVHETAISDVEVFE
jgi:hypothetical protein